MNAATIKQTNEPDSIRSYYALSRRPLASLVFVIPMLLIYEVGIIVLGPEAMRNGADVWLRNLLELIGFGQYLLLPLLTVCILLAWHHLTHQSWSMSPKLPALMLVESLVLALTLLCIAQIHGRLMYAFTAPPSVTVPSMSVGPLSGRLVAYFGAGIYEELLFRLMLLPAIATTIHWMGATRRNSLVTAILVSSLMFSAAHYQLVTAGGEPWEWFSFTFRFLAGAFFAVLFSYRGFGIAAGAHALYDVVVALYFGG
jgi:membrane protease YdiL (CAAX protease family)